MQGRVLRVLLLFAAVAAVWLGLAGAAAAAPTFTGVNPASRSNSSPGDFTLFILGSNFTEITGGLNVRLEQAGPPFDVIYATNEQVNSLLPPSITCTLNTYGQHSGIYNVVVEYYTLIGQVFPDSRTLNGVFTITQPVIMGPYITSLSPSRATVGGAAFDMLITGGMFSTSPLFPATVYWNATKLTTSGVLPNPSAVLRASVPAGLLTTTNTASIKVVNPAPGGGESNVITFDVVNPAPTLSSVSPATGWARFVQPYQVTFTGTGFVNGSQGVVNGEARPAVLLSPTELSLILTPADIASPGTLNLAVKNPEPGGGTSGARTLTLAADTTVPVTSIGGADDEWHNGPVTLTVTAADPGGSGVQKTQWGVAPPGATPVWTVLSGASVTVDPAQLGSQGAQVVSAFSTDNCGNVEQPPVTATLQFCTVGPTTTASAPGSVKRGKTLKLGYRANSITPECAVTLKILKSSGASAKTVRLGPKPSNTKGTYSFKCNLAKGKYTYKVYATDAAGNTQSAMKADTFKVN